MDAQTLIVVLLALAAAVYVGRKALRQFQGKEEPGCDKCEPGPGKGSLKK